ncbi:OmpA family protein [Sedimenticola sp.]|uniref:OmpA family protein n=1 Tax=Sedimenticola sp. TaxID=1940285 RepID=UPI0025881877|nr:OmpA family protein [Sedimenticola sp.]MCW8902854.1 OmpA family protein [Sedimenticola sp.]
MLKKLTQVLTTVLLFSFGAQADGYLFDHGDSVVHDSSGNCVHTGFWDPQDAYIGCDGAVAVIPNEEVIFAAVEPVMPEVRRISLDADTFFDFDKAQLKPAGTDKLDEIIESLRSNDSQLEVSITGHADRIGDDNYNRQLALERAMSVKQYLIERRTLQPDLLKVVSMGEDEPMVSCEGMHGQPLIDCLAPNRRVDISINATRTTE